MIATSGNCAGMIANGRSRPATANTTPITLRL
jgi:hypothetical protein